jgi:hypothetical protein
MALFGAMAPNMFAIYYRFSAGVFHSDHLRQVWKLCANDVMCRM